MFWERKLQNHVFLPEWARRNWQENWHLIIFLSLLLLSVNGKRGCPSKPVSASGFKPYFRDQWYAEVFYRMQPGTTGLHSELSQKGLNLLQMFKEMLIASGKYAPHTRRSMPATVPVKVFLTPAAAGSGSFLNGEDYEMIDFNPNNVPEGTDFGIRVSGDSMLPRYVSGRSCSWNSVRNCTRGDRCVCT